MTADLLQGTEVPDFREVGHVLASLSGVDLSTVSKATVRAWEARGLALIELSRGDRAEAERIMAPVSKRRRCGTNLAAAGAPKEEE
ncbi:hypothetical protein A7X93_00385 [Stenotrophomonas maltophilia]|uniref:hypothetical protein n=1 Tax=Stenotrophomonas maltophilia TaxID=40324 RepID=UPI000DA9A51D|nr:hypothetical protein [Stenotrophomonas maltophilia]PZT35099.1 hypothetical protein A7X93_00385 [Stenotrophomonas maltophilia]